MNIQKLFADKTFHVSDAQEVPSFFRRASRRVPFSLELLILLCVFLIGVGISFWGPAFLLLFVAPIVIFLPKEVLIFSLLASLTIDLTWISEYLRFLPDILTLVLFAKSLFYNKGIPLTKSAIKLPLFFLACNLVLGLITNYETLQIGSVIYGFRVLFLDFLIFFALLRFNQPVSFYKKVILMLFALMLLQLPIQIIQRTFGFNWSNISYSFQTPWDNNAGTFGLNGTLKLTSLCMIVFAIALSEVAFQKRTLLNIAMIAIIIFSLAITESKYGLLLVPVTAVFFTRKLWSNSPGNILKGLGLVIFVVALFTIGLLNIPQLSGTNNNSLLNQPAELWDAQFYLGDTTSSQGLPGRLGVFQLVDQYRAHVSDGNFQFLFGNGIGSTSDSSFTSLQGYLFRQFPFDQLGRTDASRIWIEFGMLGSVIYLWMYMLLLSRAAKIAASLESLDDQLMGYSTYNCVMVGLLLTPYSPVTMGAVSGFSIWLMASMCEVIHNQNRIPDFEKLQARA